MKYLNSIIVFICILGASLLNARILADQLGRGVKIPDNPKCVIALAPSIAEIIYAIDQEHRLVGATQFSDYPP